MTNWKLVTVWCDYHHRLELPRERSKLHQTLDGIYVRRWLIYIAIITVSFIALLFWVSTPADAHTVEEMEAWDADWVERFNATTVDGVLLPDLLAPLIAERVDWVDRHRWYYFPEDAPDAAAGTASQPTAGYTGMGSDVEQWRPLVTAYFGADKADIALCLMSYESGGNPNADNPNSTAAGLFQLLAQWHDYFGIDPYNPEQNISAAAQLQAMLGWSQWSPWNRGACH
jgi:hypothetical protein